MCIVEHMGCLDHFAMLGKREGKPYTFRESRRPDGRKASADRDDDGSLSFSVSGSSPQGEEETLKVGNLLVQRLNLDSSTWGEPVLGDGDDDVDCEATNVNDPSQRLQLQVVRAITDQRVWKQLNAQGATQESSVAPSSLASSIANTIKKKSEVIPQDQRRGLTLVLDATLLPGVAFDDVTEEFRRHYSAWTSSLGFEGIWLIGPVSELIQRLDQLRLDEKQEDSVG